MPEPASIDVDFLSCDYNYRDSVNSARIQGRCMVYQGKPWDLMAWSFNYSDGGFSTKSVPQLEQEAAIILSLGGGFEVYFPQKRDGSIRKWQMKLMKEIAGFCRERQHICHRARPVYLSPGWAGSWHGRRAGSGRVDAAHPLRGCR